MNLQIWDTDGSERFQSLSTAFYRGADCCAIVVDVTMPDMIKSITDWKTTVLEQVRPEDPTNFPFVVIANKGDLANEQSANSILNVSVWCR